MNDLRNYYSVGDIVKYILPKTKDAKPGEIIKVTKGTVKIKYIGYTLTLSKVNLPLFLEILIKQ